MTSSRLRVPVGGVADVGVGGEEVHEDTVVRDADGVKLIRIAPRLLCCLIPEGKEDSVLVMCFLHNPTFRV